MQITWNDKDPIYRQLCDRLKELILEGIYCDGDALPSVRQVASDQRINPITVSRAYQLLVEDNLVEKRRGLGMFVREGATDELLILERTKFLNEEWPQICERILRLGLRLETLLSEIKDKDHE